MPWIGKHLWPDALRLFGLAALSLAIGWGINARRADPLPFSYRTPEQRLEAVLHQLGANVSAAADGRISEIGLDELQSTFKQGRVQFVDARPSLFYEHGHLPGAIPLSRADFAQDYAAFRRSHTPSLGSEMLLVVYCSGEDCHDSEFVGAALVKLGYPKVHLYRGGYANWTQHSLPVEKKP